MKFLKPNLLLIVSILFVGFQRWWWWEYPVERDVSTYTLIARGLLDGRSLYSDLWDHKPPGIHITYLFGAVLFGSSQAGIALLGFVISVLTLVVLWRLMKILAPGDPQAIGFALVAFALIQSDLFLEAMQPNTEAGINLFLLVTVFFLFRLKEATRASFALVGLIGVCTLIATFFKHVGIIPIVVATIGILSKERRLISLFSITLFCVLGWGALLLLVPGAFDALIEFNRSYSGSLIQNLIQAASPLNVFSRSTWFLLPLLFISFPILRREKWLLFSLLGCWIAVALPGKLYNHYNQLYIPILCVASGLGTAYWRQYKNPLTIFLPGAVLMALLGYQVAFMFAFTPVSFSQKRHGGIFVHSKELGERLSAAKIDFELVGDSTGVSFAAGSAPKSGVIYTFPLNNDSVAESLASKLLSDLQKTAPKLLISEQGNLLFNPVQEGKLFELQEFLASSYRSCPDFHELTIHRRSDETCPGY